MWYAFELSKIKIIDWMNEEIAVVSIFFNIICSAEMKDIN